MGDESEQLKHIKLRNKFKGGPFGILIYSFSEAEMKIEARTNKKLIWSVFGILIGVSIARSLGLTIAFSEWAFLAIMIISFVINPFIFLEINEKIIIDSRGTVGNGMVWSRPCELLWSEIEKIDLESFNIAGICFIFKRNKNGKQKIRILIPFAPEVLYFIAHYYPKIHEQVAIKGK